MVCTKCMGNISDKLIDTFMFREGTEDADGELQPVVTTGSIVWGVILRSAILMILCFFFFNEFQLQNYWYLTAFLLWLGAAYPAWRQHKKFQERMEKMKESTLCGSCLHFDFTSQLCKILDEHPTRDYIPCEGLSWEPKHSDSIDE